MIRHGHLALVVLLVLVLPAAAAGVEGRDEPLPGQKQVEGRLLAPCCWRQTLDVHSSPVTTQLRREIRSRLEAGETPAEIEDAFAAQYGEGIRAFSKGGRDPRLGISFAVLAGLGASFALVFRWLTRAEAGAAARTTTAVPAEHAPYYFGRVEDELRVGQTGAARAYDDRVTNG